MYKKSKKSVDPFELDVLIEHLSDRLHNHIALVNQFYHEQNPEGLTVIVDSARSIDSLFGAITDIAFQMEKVATLQAMLPPIPFFILMNGKRKSKELQS